MSLPARPKTHFLLGPAGSGKTFRCLAEIREELAAGPDGPPLLFLAPKQATFQLERQLLAEGAIQGFTRLRILSFERLARFLIADLGAPPPDLLDEEGRIMVLRALLARHHTRLRIYRASSRLPGFARQLSALFREFQRHHVSPATLRESAARCGDSRTLQPKLDDFAALLEAYGEWLRDHALQDADELLDVATAALRTAQRQAETGPKFGGLWLDGFAEMTPQELELLAAVLPLCQRATLAYCLDAEPGNEASWLSIWSGVGRTFRQCRARLDAIRDLASSAEVLARHPATSRFSRSPVLAQLESAWSGGLPASAGEDELRHAVRIVACPDPEAEAALAAREIRRFVREGGGRFRDCAVLLRSLEVHQAPLRRAFTRLGVPFFLDRRESIAHHPVAELTGWQHEDWFGALKTGLVTGDLESVDWMENEALACGWDRDTWRKPFESPDEPEQAARVEGLRKSWVAPFLNFEAQLRGGTDDGRITGEALAGAFESLWETLDVAAQLERWSTAPRDAAPATHATLTPAAHATAWDQMQAWRDNLRRAFAVEVLTLREWIPVVDAGLASLTVGVVPPALDQVLIGTIDRSRNPELKFVILPGMNEGVFPAPPTPGVLLSDTERERLETLGVPLNAGRCEQIGHERYYGYIACTRSRERLLLTCARRDEAGRELNVSPFVTLLRRLLPGLQVEQPGSPESSIVEHANDLIPTLLVSTALPAAVDTAAAPGKADDNAPASPESHPGDSQTRRLLTECPPVAKLAEELRWLVSGWGEDRLDPALAAVLYGPVLRTSVSRFEQFAACPFRFFVNSGLRAEERGRFEVDARARGTFAHEVLAFFHKELRAEGKRWRDVTPEQARTRIAGIAERLAPSHAGGLMHAAGRNRFVAQSLTGVLQDFAAQVVRWMQSGYAFDPVEVELAFGDDDPLPAWEIDLGEGHRMVFRGKIDRVDVAADPVSGRHWCVVVDYKSSARKMEPALLAGGVQIQLPAYLAALRRLPAAGTLAGGASLAPAGLCYAHLGRSQERCGNRREALSTEESDPGGAFQHSGRLNFAALALLDTRSGTGERSGMFNFRVNARDNLPRKGGELLVESDFLRLLDDVEQTLRALGRRIYEGEAAVAPYQHSRSKACDQCDYAGVCRIDTWTHRFRALSPVMPEADEEG
jgi:ATP-dependent helicase/nuclease subunit B